MYKSYFEEVIKKAPIDPSLLPCHQNCIQNQSFPLWDRVSTSIHLNLDARRPEISNVNPYCQSLNECHFNSQSLKLVSRVPSMYAGGIQSSTSIDFSVNTWGQVHFPLLPVEIIQKLPIKPG